VEKAQHFRGSPVALSADAAAAWHAAWLTALGLRSERADTVWRALDPPPFIYWTLITLAPTASSAELGDVHGTVCDSWAALDPTALSFEERDRDGFVERAREPWFVRPPGPLAGERTPAELDVVRVTTPPEVAEFEAVSVRGFGGDDASVEPGEIHPPTILEDPRMTMLTGRVDGTAVAAAMSYRTDSAVGIYGVTTIEAARGRGYASALTRALVDPALPASLSPSPEAENLYRRLGFETVGELRQWHRG
jgi:ribosomal protein S18 acetylase RimI-like enzyme